MGSDISPLIDILKNGGLEPSMFKATIGKNSTEDEISEYINWRSPFLTYPAIGCAISHIKCWEEFIESGEDNLLILEDDAVLDENYTYERLTNIIANTPDDYDILYIGCFGSDDPNIWSLTMSWNPNHKIINEYIKIPKIALATHAYVISRKTISNLLKVIKGNVHNHIDFCLQKAAVSGKIKVYAASHRLIHQSSPCTDVSVNSGNKHPYILHNVLSHVYLDTMVKASYVSTFNVIDFFGFRLSPVTASMIVIGCLYPDINTLLKHYTILSLPDIFLGNFADTLVNVVAASTYHISKYILKYTFSSYF